MEHPLSLSAAWIELALNEELASLFAWHNTYKFCSMGFLDLTDHKERRTTQGSLLITPEYQNNSSTCNACSTVKPICNFQYQYNCFTFPLMLQHSVFQFQMQHTSLRPLHTNTDPHSLWRGGEVHRFTLPIVVPQPTCIQSLENENTKWFVDCRTGSLRLGPLCPTLE
jgi:hypothetical protein